jgi:hypothetical protein
VKRILLCCLVTELLAAGCSSPPPGDSRPESGPTARIRVFSLPNSTFLHPGKTCFSEDDPSKVAAHSGGKSFGIFNVLSVLSANKKIGMPETSDMTWSHHEFIIPAENPMTISASLNTTTEAGNAQIPRVRTTTRCGPIGVQFTPRLNRDYDTAFLVEQDRCFIRVRELLEAEKEGRVVAREIDTKPAYSCR